MKIKINLICSLVIFIIFNLGFIKNKKIFLGDSGSTTLGFIWGWLLVYYAHSSNNNLDPSLSIWCVTVPVFDLLSLLIIRTNNKKNPFRDFFISISVYLTFPHPHSHELY